ncbi:MAG: ExbD/TolR family protein, partial [Gemmataceae bacterium]
MKWRVRHEGSPESVERTLPELERGLADGLWETTDEVQEPGATRWLAFEAHPHFAEACEELEAPPKPAQEAEAHLDMNALIDVTMVLLIFFILTTTMAALQKRIEAPSTKEGKVKVPRMTPKQVEEQAVLVKAAMSGGALAVTVEGKPVTLDRLTAELRKYVTTTTKTSLLLDHDDQVTQDTVIQIQDSALKAGLQKIQFVVP